MPVKKVDESSSSRAGYGPSKIKLATDAFFPYFLVLLLLGAAFAIGALWMKSGGAITAVTPTVAPSQPGAGNNQPTQPANVDAKNVKINGPFIGSANAPLILAYWRDYQCPFCQRFEKDTLETIVTQYVKTGKVKVVFKDFQFLGPDSQTIALAGRAVWEIAPDKYYDWQKYVFDNQGGENSGWGTKDKIVAMTRKVAGIDADKVSALMDSKKDEYQKAIDADKAEGSQFGVNSTPSAVVGTQLIIGAQPLATFTAAIDSQLK